MRTCRTLSMAAVAALALGGCGPGPQNAEQAGARLDSAAKATMTDAQTAYDKVNQRMHAGMKQIDIDADVAFMRGMLAHHRGAVEMSEVELKYGKDPQARALAERIIKAQQAEIAEMQAWLSARKSAGGEPAPAPAPAGGGHAHH